MSQEKPFRVNLGAAAFPLCSDWMGRSVMIPNLDESGTRNPPNPNEDPQAREASSPQIYYCHNVMPVGQGFKSIAYKRLVIPPAPALTTFDKIIPVKDSNENKGFLAFTTNGRIFIIAAGDSSWTEILGIGWAGGASSYAYANGTTYVCLSLFNVFTVNVLGRTITPASLIGITPTAIKGIAASSNYLLAHDNVTTYWSSASNPNDFTPSLATGAGSGTPQDLNGQIVCVIPLANGFAIYTTVNIIVASYSGNIRYPWIFRQAPNSGGITDIRKIAQDADGGANYAWTSSGLLRVSPTGCVAVHPEVTDYLAGRIFEDFNDTTNFPTQQYLTSDMQIRMTFTGSRYLVISYGITSYTHALIYDTALKRWGKLKVAHVDCFEMIVYGEQNLSWNSLYPNSWSFFAGTAWQSLSTMSNLAASPKRTLGFLQQDGTLQLAVWDYGNFGANAVIMIGKFTLVRNQKACMQEVRFETMDPTNPTFGAYLQTFYDGKALSVLSTLVQNTLDDPTSRTKRYNKLITGDAHTILAKGAFNLVTIEAKLTVEGSR